MLVDEVQKQKIDLMKRYNLTDNMIKCKCSEDHILEIQKFVSWKVVGPYLPKIKRLSDINAIDRDGKYEADKRRLLVDLWEERCGDDAT